MQSPFPLYGVYNGMLRHTVQTNAHTFASVSGIATASAWFDGEARTRQTTSPANSWTSADGGGAIGNDKLKPEYYSVRIYNRELSAAELRRHARIDRIRFFGADEGMRPGADGDEYRVRVTTPDGAVTDTWYASNATVKLSYQVKSGETFRFWKPVPEDVADRTATNISFSVTEPLSTTARLVESVHKLSAASYVTNGLVLQYDGIANAGIDADGDELHDGNSCYWADLSGEGQRAVIVTNDGSIRWLDDACDQMAAGYVKGGYFSFSIGDAFYAAQNNRNGSAIQLCGRKRKEGAGLNCYTHIVGYNGGWSYYMLDLWNSMSYHAGGVCYSFSNAAASTNMTLTTCFTTEGAPSGNAFLRTWYGADNYNQYTVSTTSMKDLTGRTGYIFGVWYYDQGFILRAARFYNRPLDDYERLLNTRIDEERFYGSNVTKIVSVESDAGVNYGTPAGFAYGAYRVQPGAAIDCSFTDSLALYADGIRALAVAEGERTGLTGCWVSNRVTGVAFREGASAFSGTADDDFRLVWSWRHQFRLDYVASSGGGVTCGKASGGWFDEGTYVSLVAAPDDQHKFAGWAGDTAGLDDLSAAAISVPMDRARSLTAVFQEKHHTPVSLTWLGGATGRWSDPANWGGTLPQEGDEVTIGADATVALDTAMPALAELNVAGTLSAAGWANMIRAEAVTVADGGVLTCAGGFSAEGDISNRVWIVCGTLTVDQGGAINVSGKGWCAAAGTYGAGPGAGTVSGCGGAYGGYAGSGSIGTADSTQMTSPYGNAADPRDPGSAGSAASLGNASYCGGAGGGAVLVEATGCVTLNGSITANGLAATGTHSGGGSGGGVSIRCQTVTGGGTVSARGGSGVGKNGGHGAGGRIAVSYDKAAQALLARPALAFDAGCPIPTSVFAYETYHTYGEGGTVWFPDGALLVPESFNVTGQVHIDGASLAMSSIVLDSRRVAFTQDGFRLSVAGDVVLQGTGTALELGGAQLVHRATCGNEYMSHNGWRRFGDAAPVDVRIGGKLTVGGTKGEVILRGAKMTLADADPADGRPVGGLLKVGGTFSIAKGCRLVTVSHYWTGVSPRIEARRFELAEGASVGASAQGYYASNLQPTALPLEGQNGSYGFGPGAPTEYATGYIGPGGCHIGLGSREGTTVPATYLYDSTNMPHMAGSGCANDFNAGGATGGGGVVFLEVSGSCRIAGSIVANGGTQGSGHASGCAGGSIYLKASRLYLADTAVLQAKGGNGSSEGGDGGGGGIAIWRVVDAAGSALTAETTPEALIAAGRASAAAGTHNTANFHPTDGTVVLGFLPPAPMRIIIR